MREFISMCLQPAEKRPSAKQLLEQKVFDLSETSKSATAATHQHPHPHTQHAADGATTNTPPQQQHHQQRQQQTAPTEQKVSEGAKKNRAGHTQLVSTLRRRCRSLSLREQTHRHHSSPTAPNASSASTALSVVLPQHAQTTPIPTNTPNGPAPPSPQMRAVTDALTPPLISPASLSALARRISRHQSNAHFPRHVGLVAVTEKPWRLVSSSGWLYSSGVLPFRRCVVEAARSKARATSGAS